MGTSPAASFLVAALVMLRRPCPRNQATARMLLRRAAEQAHLTMAEREACLNLADEMESDAYPASRRTDVQNASPNARFEISHPV
ncbi:MAG: hypothetical protein IV085_11705 [Thiobacillus sp.]|nr:hypothetical protein [Thiobacillus sp.]